MTGPAHARRRHARGLLRRPPRPAARRRVGPADRQQGAPPQLLPRARQAFFSNRGHFDHDELIGREEGFTVTSSAGGEYLVFRPLLSEFVVSMPRGAAVVYPKDAAQIVAMADVFPGAHVVEAGRRAPGALTCSLLRAVGPHGRVSSYERREEFADVARRNVDQFFGGRRTPPGRSPSATSPRRCRRQASRSTGSILDMLAPWDCLDAVGRGAARPAASSARTSPPRPSCPASSRRCAPTAASPSRRLGVAGARLARRGSRRPARATR